MSQPPTQSSQPQLSAGNQSNPLDQLEELIKNAQSKSGKAAGDEKATSPEAPTPEQQVQDNKQQLEKIEQLKAQKAQEEQQLVIEQQQLIQQEVTGSDQSHLREEIKAEEIAQRQPPPEGMQIRQLDHIKIQKQTE